MYVEYMLFAGIALLTGAIILFRILSSELKYQEKGFIQLIILAILHNIIDIFWGITYFDKTMIKIFGEKELNSILHKIPFLKKKTQ